jgi:hypothetical protein
MSRGGGNPLFGKRSEPRSSLRKEIRVEEHDGSTRWLLDGRAHRIGFPAVLHPNGIEEWRQHGELHRDGGPALIVPDDFRATGQVIEDLVAAALPDGHSDLDLCGPGRAWFFHGQLHRDDGPAVVDTRPGVYRERRAYYRLGKLDRSDGPALSVIAEAEAGDLQEWYRQGELHREDGPARVHDAGSEYYLDGKPRPVCRSCEDRPATVSGLDVAGERIDLCSLCLVDVWGQCSMCTRYSPYRRMHGSLCLSCESSS